eukprot:6695049-Karenia_brevis.AAC.1
MRWVDLVLLHKGLFLFHFNQSHTHVVCGTTYDMLVERTQNILTSLEITPHVTDVLGMVMSDVSAADLAEGWLKLTMKQAGIPAFDHADAMPEILTYHADVTMKMSGHLRLTWENINTCEWLSGGILNKDPHKARECARLFHDELKRKRANAMRPYEQAWVEDHELMIQLDDFASQDPPYL